MPKFALITPSICFKLALQSAIRPGWENAWAWLTALSALVGVLLPVLLVLLANLSILEALGRERRQRGNKNKASMPTPSASPQLLPRPSSAQRRHQRRATLAVLVIACTFTLCQTPSALIHLLEVCWPSVGQLHAFRTAAVLSNFLVFFQHFCLSIKPYLGGHLQNCQPFSPLPLECSFS